VAIWGLLGDCFLWAVFLNCWNSPIFWLLSFHIEEIPRFILTKIGWAAFWAILCINECMYLSTLSPMFIPHIHNGTLCRSSFW
jgi:hypothetical protein